MARLEQLDALGRHIAGQEEALLRSGDHEQLLAAIVAKTAQGRRPFRDRMKRALLVAAAVLATAFGLRLVLHREAQPLSFFVGSRELQGTVGSWISAPEAAAVPIRFSDGTRGWLSPGARGRVVSVSPFGAEIVVEAGRARFDVVPRPSGRWRVSTGPFIVHVTGTRFEVEWHPEQDA